MRKLYIKIINLLYTVVKADLDRTMKEVSIFPRFLCSEKMYYRKELHSRCNFFLPRKFTILAKLYFIITGFLKEHHTVSNCGWMQVHWFGDFYKHVQIYEVNWPWLCLFSEETAALYVTYGKMKTSRWS